MHNVFIGLGSNKGDRLSNLKNALKLMRQKGLIPIKTSCVYESLPFLMQTENLFLNAAVLVETLLSPQETLDILEEIECALGRSPEAKGKNLDRDIDLDILFFAELVVRNERLIIPHPAIPQREFVLLPLLDMEADLLDCVSGVSISDMYDNLSAKGICKKIDAKGLI